MLAMQVICVREVMLVMQVSWVRCNAGNAGKLGKGDNAGISSLDTVK